jgi:hypothetical protein
VSTVCSADIFLLQNCTNGFISIVYTTSIMSPTIYVPNLLPERTEMLNEKLGAELTELFNEIADLETFS